MVISTRMIARAGVLVAVSVAMGWLTIAIPNVELITASIFISGFWCGFWWGGVIGVVAEGLFSLTNPVGMPTPPLLIAQCMGMAAGGMAGGMVRTTVAGQSSIKITTDIGRNWFSHYYGL